MKSLYLGASAALLSVLACAAPSTAADQLVLNDVHWVAEPAAEKGGAPRVRIQHKRSSSDQTLDGLRADFAEAEAALGRNTAGPVDFTIAHEAGTLSCTGTLIAAFAGEGDCRFAADAGFERALAARGLMPEKRGDLLAMLLVDATIALADGLTNEGVKPKDNGDLLGAAALDITPAYVRDLRSEALALTEVEDVIACKALGVDGAYVRGLAEAGYRGLDADEVVAMKALGVTPQYALAMNRAQGSGQ